MTRPSIYTIGGTVQAGEGVYIRRRADEDLLALCRAGTFTYVLTARQMGKSSLMVHTAERLAEEGIRSAIVDLTELGVQLTAEEWYLGLLTRIGLRLGLQTNVVDWWQTHAILGVTQRLALFFQHVVLTEIEEPVVIFVDEIDSTLDLDFTDDFFAAIRYLYNTRAVAPELQRLCFVLLGVTTPGDLINDPNRTPFNIGQWVNLADFEFEEAEPLAAGLSSQPDKASKTLNWILTWTGGHPYLTQRLCSFVANQNWPKCTEADVENAVAVVFYGQMSERDNNLQFVCDMLTKRAPDPTGVLATYRDIRRGRRLVRDEEQSVVKTHLKLSGIVHREGDVLQVRNPIYEQVFNLQWIKDHWPVNWRATIPRAVKVAAGIIALLFVALILISGFALAQQRRAERQARVAKAERDSAQRAVSRQLATQALAHLDDQLDLALLLSVEALRIADTDQARISLETALAHNPQLTTHLHGHAGPVHTMGFSPDGTTLASGDLNGTIILWDLVTDQPIGEPFDGAERREYIELLAFSSDGKTLISHSTDSILLWDVATRRPRIFPLKGAGDQMLRSAFSPDGRKLAFGNQDGTITLWDAETGELLGPPLTGHDGEVWYVAFGPDGRTLASSSVDGVILWDVSTGAVKGRLAGDATEGGIMVPSPDLETGALANDDGTITLWDLTSGEPLGLTLSGHSAFVTNLAFSPDGQTLASGDSDGVVMVWDVTTGEAIGAPLTGHGGEYVTLAFSPDGRTLASASDQTVMLWSVARHLPQGRRLAGANGRDDLMDFSGQVTSVAFSPDGQTLASAYLDGTINLWSVALGAPLRPSLSGHTDGVWFMAFGSDGEKLTSVDGRDRIITWDVATGQPLRESDLGRSLTAWGVSFSPNGQTLALGTQDGPVVLWDVTRGETIDAPLTGPTLPITMTTFAFSKDGRTLAGAGCKKGDFTDFIKDYDTNNKSRTVNCDESEIWLWDLTTRQPIHSPFTGLPGRIYRLAFSPDGQTLAAIDVAGRVINNYVFVWDLAADPPARRLLNDQKHGMSLAFSPDGRTLASTGPNSAVILWDVATGVEKRRFGGQYKPETAIAFSPDGSALASGNVSGIVMLWEFPDLPQPNACRRANRNLTQEEWEQFIGPDIPYQQTCADLPLGEGVASD